MQTGVGGGVRPRRRRVHCCSRSGHTLCERASGANILLQPSRNEADPESRNIFVWVGLFFPLFFLPTAADKYCIFNFIQSSIAPVVWQIFICPFYAKSLLLYCFCVCTRWVCCVCPRQTASVWCAVQQCRCVQWLVRGLICSEWVRENVVFMYSCCAEYRFPMIGLAHKHTSYLPTIHSFSNMLSPPPPLGHRYSSRLSGGWGWDTLTFVYPIFLCHEFSILQEMSIYKFALLALLYFPHIEQFCILNHTFIHSCYLTKHCILYICIYIVYTCLYIVFFLSQES